MEIYGKAMFILFKRVKVSLNVLKLITYDYKIKIDLKQDNQWDPKDCLKTTYSKKSYHRENQSIDLLL